MDGTSAPLGATVSEGGVNFSLYSKHASRVELLLFDTASAAAPSRVVPVGQRAYHYWHAFVAGIRPGQIYGYRVHGPFEPERGMRFDGAKLLLDPYGRAVAVPDGYDRLAGARPGGNIASAMKSVVANPAAYDWQDDRHPRRPFVDTVIYETHVRGFSMHESSGVAPHTRGTYAGIVEKIPYLRDLGVTAVELLPVFQFDPQTAPPGLINYWGYQPVSFFAPHLAYSSNRNPLGALDEFRDMVRALHRAGLEVILDVVYNHSAEGAHDGPTQCFRGLANDVYYILEQDRSRYADFTGCGNTLNANHPIVRRLIQDSLRYWATEMHVDGFRFDLASILSRDEDGTPHPNPPVVWDIESDPALAGTKLIAEAWDAAGMHQVGRFPGDAWQEWNGHFRDDVRSFVKGDEKMACPLAKRMLGSPDIFGHEDREAEQSINFVTCHDGFTLNDLVSYDRKHNEANGEDNRDGFDDNRSWNCGVEGPTDDPAIETLRNRQVKNLLAIELLSAGTPMLLMGDEVRRTQLGNNNAYCHDGPIAWFDWTLIERHRDVHRFVRELIVLRQTREVTTEPAAPTLRDLLERVSVEWHGVKVGQPDWSDHSHSVAMLLRSFHGRRLYYAIFNAYWQPLTFELPPAPAGQAWRRLIDTTLASPNDISPWDAAPAHTAPDYVAEPRSVVVLTVPLEA